MPGTETDLCNEALNSIGDTEIGSILDTNDTRAKVCRRLYPAARDYCLRLREWNCAEHYQSLAGREVTPFVPNEFAKAYQLPQDPYCLKARRIADVNASWYGNRFEPSIIPFRIAGRVLLTDAIRVNAPVSTVAPTLVYTRLITDTALYDSMLWECVVEYLAANLALALGPRDISMKLKLMEAFVMKWDQAVAVDQTEGQLHSSTSSVLVTIRR